MTTQHAPGNPYADDPDELLSTSEWDGEPAEEQPPPAEEKQEQ